LQGDYEDFLGTLIAPMRGQRSDVKYVRWDVVRFEHRSHQLYAVSDDTGINNIQGEISGSPIKSRRRARAPEKKEARSVRAQVMSTDGGEPGRGRLPAGVLNEIRRRIRGQSGAGI